MHYYRIDLRAQSGRDGEFGAYQTIDGLSQQLSALDLLRRCAYIVGPIMRRRGWIAPVMSELHPDDECLGKSLFKTRITTRGRYRSTASTPT